MKTRLLSIIGVLVFVSAAIHLSLGIAGLVEAVSGGGSVLLPALYLLGGLAAIALLGTIVLTPVATTAYAAGAGLMVLFLLAYADVHAVGVAESTLGVDLHDHGDHDHGGDGHSHDHGHDDHDHDDGTLTVLADHLREDAYALISKTAEAGAAVGFAALAVLGDRE